MNLHEEKESQQNTRDNPIVRVLSMYYNCFMSFFKWMLVIFVAPIPVMIGILLSIPVIIAGGIILIIALLLPPIYKSFRNRLHPLRRRHPHPSSWHQWR